MKGNEKVIMVQITISLLKYEIFVKVRRKIG
jgi:hypothetical protein